MIANAVELIKDAPTTAATDAMLTLTPRTSWEGFCDDLRASSKRFPTLPLLISQGEAASLNRLLLVEGPFWRQWYRFAFWNSAFERLVCTLVLSRRHVARNDDVDTHKFNNDNPYSSQSLNGPVAKHHWLNRLWRPSGSSVSASRAPALMWRCSSLPLRSNRARRRAVAVQGFRQGLEFGIFRGLNAFITIIVLVQFGYFLQTITAKASVVSCFDDVSVDIDVGRRGPGLSSLLQFYRSSEKHALLGIAYDVFGAQSKDLAVLQWLLLLPLIWGLSKAAWLYCRFQSRRTSINTLVAGVRAQRAGLWTDYFRWILPFHPMDRVLNALVRELQWNAQLDSQDGTLVVDLLVDLAVKRRGYTAIVALSHLQSIAYSLSIRDWQRNEIRSTRKSTVELETPLMSLARTAEDASAGSRGTNSKNGSGNMTDNHVMCDMTDNHVMCEINCDTLLCNALVSKAKAMHALDTVASRVWSHHRHDSERILTFVLQSVFLPIVRDTWSCFSSVYARYLLWTLGCSTAWWHALVATSYKLLKFGLQMLFVQKVLSAFAESRDCPLVSGVSLSGTTPHAFELSSQCMQVAIDVFGYFPGQAVSSVSNVIADAYVPSCINITMDFANRADFVSMGQVGLIIKALKTYQPLVQVTGLHLQGLSGGQPWNPHEITTPWLPSLLVLDLSSTSFNQANLSIFPALTSLDLSYCPNMDFTAVEFPLALHTLVVNAGGAPWGQGQQFYPFVKPGETGGVSLNTLTHLQTLSLNSWQISVDGSVSVDDFCQYEGTMLNGHAPLLLARGFSNYTQMENLSLSGNNIGSCFAAEAVVIARELSHMTKLQSLDLSYNNFLNPCSFLCDGGDRPPHNGSSFHHVIQASDAKSPPALFALLESASSFPGLRTLDLSNNDPYMYTHRTDEYCHPVVCPTSPAAGNGGHTGTILSRIIDKLPHITTLNLGGSYTFAASTGWPEFFESLSRSGRSLQQLRLPAMNVTAPAHPSTLSFEVLLTKTFSSLPHLRVLDISSTQLGCPTTPKLYRDMCNATEYTPLTTLDFIHNLTHLQSLEELRIDNNCVLTPILAKSLADTVATMPRLQTIEIVRPAKAEAGGGGLYCPQSPAQTGLDVWELLQSLTQTAVKSVNPIPLLLGSASHVDAWCATLPKASSTEFIIDAVSIGFAPQGSTRAEWSQFGHSVARCLLQFQKLERIVLTLDFGYVNVGPPPFGGGIEMQFDVAPVFDAIGKLGDSLTSLTIASWTYFGPLFYSGSISLSSLGAALRHLTLLTELTIDFGPFFAQSSVIVPQAVTLIQGMRFLPQLETLQIPFFKLVDEYYGSARCSFPALEALGGTLLTMGKLRVLNITSTGLGEMSIGNCSNASDAVGSLTRSFQTTLQALTVLDISNNRIGCPVFSQGTPPQAALDFSLNIAMSIARMKSLTTVSLGGVNCFEGAAASELTLAVLTLPSLKRINMENVPVDSAVSSRLVDKAYTELLHTSCQSALCRLTDVNVSSQQILKDIPPSVDGFRTADIVTRSTMATQTRHPSFGELFVLSMVVVTTLLSAG